MQRLSQVSANYAWLTVAEKRLCVGFFNDVNTALGFATRIRLGRGNFRVARRVRGRGRGRVRGGRVGGGRGRGREGGRGRGEEAPGGWVGDDVVFSDDDASSYDTISDDRGRGGRGRGREGGRGRGEEAPGGWVGDDVVFSDDDASSYDTISDDRGRGGRGRGREGGRGRGEEAPGGWVGDDVVFSDDEASSYDTISDDRGRGGRGREGGRGGQGRGRNRGRGRGEEAPGGQGGDGVEANDDEDSDDEAHSDSEQFYFDYGNDPPHTTAPEPIANTASATTSPPLTTAPTTEAVITSTEQLHTSLEQTILTEAVITATEQLHTSLEQTILTEAVITATEQLHISLDENIVRSLNTTSLPQPNLIDAITGMEKLRVPTSRGQSIWAWDSMASGSSSGSGSKRKAEEVLGRVSPQLSCFGGMLQFLMKELPTKKVPINRQMIIEEVDRFFKDNNINVMVDAALLNEVLDGSKTALWLVSGGGLSLIQEGSSDMYYFGLQETHGQIDAWKSWEQYKLDLQKNEGAE